MALPNSNISTTLVGQTLGTSSRDVGTLCTHPNINWMSIHKPVRFNKVTGLLDNEFKGELTQDYYDGIENYGIRKKSVKYAYGNPSYNSGGAPTYLVGTTPDLLSTYWSYMTPRGFNYSEPYRLGDFRNYEHSNLAFPISQKKVPINGYGSAFYQGDSIVLSAYLRYDLDDFNNNLGLSKLFDVSSASSAPATGLHFGFIAESTTRNNVSSLPGCYVIYYGSKLGNYDPMTGTNYTKYASITMPVSSIPISNESAQPNIFHIGETIRVYPMLWAYTGSTDSGGRPYTIIYSLSNTKGNVIPFSYTIPNTPLPSSIIEITNTNFTITRTSAAGLGFDSTYNTFMLNTLALTVKKPNGYFDIEFLSDLDLSPTTSVDVGAVVSGSLPSTFELTNSGGTQILNQSIITNRGSTAPYRPYIVLKTTAAADISLSFRYKKFGSINQYVNKVITVPPL